MAVVISLVVHLRKWSSPIFVFKPAQKIDFGNDQVIELAKKKEYLVLHDVPLTLEYAAMARRPNKIKFLFLINYTH